MQRGREEVMSRASSNVLMTTQTEDKTENASRSHLLISRGVKPITPGED